MHIWDIVLIDPILNVLVVLSKVSFHSFGLAVIELALISRLVMLPFTQWSMRSSLRMSEVRSSLTPFLEKVQKKYAKNPVKKLAETRRYQREVGASPLGCLFSPPLLTLAVLIPVFVACSRSVRILGAATPQDVLGLSQKLYSWPVLDGALPLSPHFLWFDLTRPDPYFVLPVLVLGSAWISLKMATQPTSAPQAQFTQSVMQMAMPVLMAILTATVPAGLGVYLLTIYAFSIVNGYFVYGWGGLYQLLSASSSGRWSWSRPLDWSRAVVVAIKAKGVGAVTKELVLERGSPVEKLLPPRQGPRHVTDDNGRREDAARKAFVGTSRRAAAVCLAFIIAYAVFIRCLHLFNADHYFILSNDSYFFHWSASRILIGESAPIVWHSGLTYPLAWTAKLIGSLAQIPSWDALQVASKLVPVVIAGLTIILMYVAVSRIYNRTTALFAAFAWAALTSAAYIGSAGYLDRDGLSVLLITAGAFAFHFCARWHHRMGRLDVGWLAGGLAVLVIEAILVLEWMWLGAVLLLTILIFFVAAEVGAAFLPGTTLFGPSPEERKRAPRDGRPVTTVSAALLQSSWRPLLFVLGVSAVAALLSGQYRGVWTQAATVVAGDDPSSELAAIGIGDILAYRFLLVPLSIGIYFAVTRLRRSDLFVLAWFICLFIAGLFARRMFVFYAAPAGCILAGLGLATLWNGQAERFSLQTASLRKAAAVFLVLLTLLLALSAYWFPTNPRAAPGRAYYEAMIFLKENSPEEATVMTWWDYGYFIWDIAGRRPVADGGFVGYQEDKMRDIARAYCTADTLEAASVMKKYDAQYLIFTRLDMNMLPIISQNAYGIAYGDGETIPVELKDSLYSRALGGSMNSESGLRIFYQSPGTQNPGVVIIELAELVTGASASDR